METERATNGTNKAGGYKTSVRNEWNTQWA
jgi:hypothetical protein